MALGKSQEPDFNLWTSDYLFSSSLWPNFEQPPRINWDSYLFSWIRDLYIVDFMKNNLDNTIRSRFSPLCPVCAKCNTRQKGLIRPNWLIYPNSYSHFKTNTQTQILKLKYSNSNNQTQILTLKYSHSNTHTQILCFHLFSTLRDRLTDSIFIF